MTKTMMICHKFSSTWIGRYLNSCDNMHLPMLYTAYKARPMVVCKTICKTTRDVKKNSLFLLYRIGMLGGSKWEIIEVTVEVWKERTWSH